MVSFSCESCGDIFTKKKLDPHRNRCRGATFTCIDCMVHFPGTEYRAHTSCVTEDQKYQGALYKGKKQQQQQGQATSSSAQHNMARHRPAYVEDVVEGYEPYYQYGSNYDGTNYNDFIQADYGQVAPPPAPTPPPVTDSNGKVNVFDFYVGQATPTASVLNLKQRIEAADVAAIGVTQLSGSNELVRYDQNADGFVDQAGYTVGDAEMVQYGTGPVPALVQSHTPVPKAQRRKTKVVDREGTKHKKRKRRHAGTGSPQPLDDDLVMTDAPPELHSGLTGRLNRLMQPAVFPPSPDYSGGDGGGNSPPSPSKKTKRSKSSKPKTKQTFGSNLKALVSGSCKTTSVSKKRRHSSERAEKHRHHQSDGDKPAKRIEFRSPAADGPDEEGKIVVYKPRSDLFLSLCDKGPESARGYSIHRALKRYHRERTSSGSSLGKAGEEKELWRSLRVRRNDRGELVLFSIDS